MKKPLIQIYIVFSMVVFVACASPYSGQLNVREQITLVNTSEENISLSPGEYKVDVRWKKGESYFEFAFSGKRIDKQTVRFHGNAGSILPDGSGNLYIPANGSGQPLDLKGDVHSKQSKTDIQLDFDLCTVQRMLTQCSPGKPVRCRQIWKTFPGKRNVEYYHVVNEKDLPLQLTDPVSAQEIADFGGKAFDRWRVYTYRGDCFWVE